MYKLLNVEANSDCINEICYLLTKYRELIFSDICNPLELFFNGLNSGKIKVIAAYKENTFLAFLCLYDFKKISNDTFCCYMYGAAKRGFARDLDILFKPIFEDLKNQGCKVIRCQTKIHNLPMRFLANRLGFRKVGILKNCEYSEGKFQDNYLYEKILL